MGQSHAPHWVHTAQELLHCFGKPCWIPRALSDTDTKANRAPCPLLQSKQAPARHCLTPFQHSPTCCPDAALPSVLIHCSPFPHGNETLLLLQRDPPPLLSAPPPLPPPASSQCSEMKWMAPGPPPASIPSLSPTLPASSYSCGDTWGVPLPPAPLMVCPSRAAESWPSFLLLFLLLGQRLQPGCAPALLPPYAG